jgi:hypothetical protein
VATAEPLAPTGFRTEEAQVLASQWRRLTRSATLVAVLTSPATFFWLREVVGWSTLWSLVGTFFAVIAFRGVIDLVFRRAIPWPSLFALFFHKSDLAAQLSRPLTHTLRARPSFRPGDMGPIEGIVVDRLTLPHLFRTQPSQAQDGSVILVLDPAALGS